MARQFTKATARLAVSIDGVKVYPSGPYQWTVEYPDRKLRLGCDGGEGADGWLNLVSPPWPGRRWDRLDGGEGEEMSDAEREQVRADFEAGLTALEEKWVYRNEALRVIY